MSAAEPVRLALHAMATRFEVALYGSDQVRLRAAGEEAIREIERVEAQLTFFGTGSELNRLNRDAAKHPVRVDPRLFSLIEHSAELSVRTQGAFDITIAPLMRAWGFVSGAEHVPDALDLEGARRKVGMVSVLMDSTDHTISFDRAGVEIDLGGVGKGYAIERAVEILRENGVESALIHGGTSTLSGIGRPPESQSWQIAVRDPSGRSKSIARVSLRDNSLSVSAVHGKSFTDGDVEYGHVIDPRTGRPVLRALLAAVIGPGATDCDALSTALLVLGRDGLSLLTEEFPEFSGFIVLPDGRMAVGGRNTQLWSSDSELVQGV